MKKNILRALIVAGATLMVSCASGTMSSETLISTANDVNANDNLSTSAEPATAASGDEFPIGTWSAEHNPPSNGSIEANCPNGSWVSSLSGHVRSNSGQLLEAASVGMCVSVIKPDNSEVSACISPVLTDASGAYTLSVPEKFRCLKQAEVAVSFTSNTRTVGSTSPEIHFATTYCALDLFTKQADLSADYIIYRTMPAISQPALGEETMMRWVEFQGGLSLMVQPDLLPQEGSAEYANLASINLAPTAANACLLKDAPTLTALYGFSPQGLIGFGEVGEQFPVRIMQNAIAPGTTVDLYVLGGADCSLPDGTLVPEGTWAKFSSAVVAEDGSIQTTDESGHLPCLTWLGLGD